MKVFKCALISVAALYMGGSRNVYCRHNTLNFSHLPCMTVMANIVNTHFLAIVHARKHGPLVQNFSLNNSVEMVKCFVFLMEK